MKTFPFRSKASFAVDTLYHIYYYLSHFVQHFSSKTLAKVLCCKNGDISVEFLLNSISIQHETQKKGRLHKRGLSRRHCSTTTQRPLLNYCFGLKENSKGPFCQENYISLYKKRGRKLCCWHQRVFHLHTETNCYLSFS